MSKTLSRLAAIIMVAFGLSFFTDLANAQSYTPWVRVYGGNSTGPFTSSVGAQIPWRFESLGADRINFYARPTSTTGNCGMNVNEWFDWKPTTTTRSATISTDAASACQAGGTWQVAAIATKGTLSSTHIVDINMLPKGRSSVALGSGATASYVMDGKATVQSRANGSATDRLFQQRVSDEPSMCNFLYNTARQAVGDWNQLNGYTYGDPVELYADLTSRFCPNGDVGMNTFASRVTTATGSGTLTLLAANDWLWQATTNPASTCSRAVVLFGINTRSDRPVTTTIQTLTGSACSADAMSMNADEDDQAIKAERRRLGMADVIKTTVVHVVPENAPLPDRQSALGRNN